ncbi:hypothetical protein T07_1704 [Trichinella nelsoni]|uniref:Uncharacterized protein n=1 Tax=Trichinella nelsoni TaxID=6336 RepID=A0A0V0SGM4_9BILA|nr:hypothetical protein T07_1704 [Trichinella nelsoni]
MALFPGQAPIVTTRRVRPADLPPGPRQFVRRCCVLVHSRSLGLVSLSTSSEHASTRTTRPHVGQRSRSGKIFLALRHSNI